MSVNKKIIETEAQVAIEDTFNVVTYTGNGSTQSITGVGFQPDLVWIKQRNGTNPHGLWDSIRGAGKLLKSNTTEAESGNAGDLLGSFDSDGFQVNRNYLQYTGFDNTNYNSATYVAWCWKANGGTTSSNTDGSITSTVQANQAAGFSIVKWTGTGSNLTVGTGLTTAADLIITKAIGTVSPSVGEAWPVFHSSLTNNNIGYLDQDYAASSGNKSTVYQDPTTTSTTFKVGNWRGINQNGLDMISYCFHSVDGYSKIGSYTGATSGVTVTVGFRPDFLLIKSSSNVEHWAILDTVRGSGKVVNPNRSNAESDSTLNTFTVSDTGFSFPHQNTADAMLNENGYTYIYMAFKIN